MHKFDRAKFDKRVLARETTEDKRTTDPSPNNIPGVVERIDLIEEYLGFNGE